MKSFKFILFALMICLPAAKSWAIDPIVATRIHCFATLLELSPSFVDFKTRVYLPVEMGDNFGGSSYVLESAGHAPRLVRRGRLNGMDYQFDLPQSTTFEGGATQMDPRYVLRLEMDYRGEEFRVAAYPQSEESFLSEELRVARSFVTQNILDDGLIYPSDLAKLDAGGPASIRRRISVVLVDRDDKPRAAIEWLDGSANPGLFAGLYSESFSRAEDQKLKTEKLFPNLKLPERAAGDRVEVHEILNLASEIPWGAAYLFQFVSALHMFKYGSFGRIPRPAIFYGVTGSPESALAEPQRRRRQARIRAFETRYGWEVVPSNIPMKLVDTELVLLRATNESLLQRRYQHFFWEPFTAYHYLWSRRTFVNPFGE